MASIVELFPKNRKLAYDARQQLAQVQNGLLPPSELFMLLEEISRSLDIMENLLSRETPSQREVWRRKILELRDDANSVRRQAEHYDRMVGANVRQQRERDALLSRRRRTRRATGEEGEINDLADEYQSMESSQIMMGDLLASGQASLTGLIEQRQRMKGVKRVMLDIGSKIGLSNSTMRIIERRDVTDAYFVFGGMVVCLLLMYFLYL
uniref:Golgi SNAP receptor complex member 2 n=1 Tax=Attheya septentrionalis TaxID=420275 RepID=A0A7S2XN21_9STRA|mmetsp:Transcript_23342/g.42122  ORF Transcript_23342/g.42122 Transcript_23342/m.42122 type:complete len:209 (+) Transcript_23342:223-849(+)|eukprot:CAMPEP_0198290672 /NCGR_PEP_ID=MMETSP1449-20131203/8445_1 /TAXON_ID=420275 /ORGANISM="Attheya septentrionalis, Strain CCMP2084" /LENGTH=208 /DNA_ID=CAMNT_0043989201 /DNA_START=155 /DNA_END=781 /DNA_ORIENTATION=+